MSVGYSYVHVMAFIFLLII